MTGIFNPDDFALYNGFYRKPQCRRIVFGLYKGKCTGCRERIDANNFHVAHIIPRSRPDLMGALYPGLDVDNLLNLWLSCPQCNLRESNYVITGPGLTRSFNIAAGTIARRLPALLAPPAPRPTSPVITKTDALICTSVLQLKPDDVRCMATAWRGALIVPLASLQARVRHAIIETMGEDGAEELSNDAIDEGLGYCRNRLVLREGSYLLTSTGECQWLQDAETILQRTIDALDVTKGVRYTIDLLGGVYVDAEELTQCGGLRFPLRSKSQRWFHDIFATLFAAQRKLAAQPRGDYWALSDEDWDDLHRCYDKLREMEVRVRKMGRRFAPPYVCGRFDLSGTQLMLDDNAPNLSAEVRQRCRVIAAQSPYGYGALACKAHIKPWLVRAVALTTRAAQLRPDPLRERH